MRQRAVHCRFLAIRDGQEPYKAEQWIGIAKQWDLLAEASDADNALRGVEGSARGGQSSFAGRPFATSINTGNLAIFTDLPPRAASLGGGRGPAGAKRRAADKKG